MTKTQHDSETLAEGKQVITACAFIYKIVDGEVLLFSPRRAETKKFLPGVFELPGGHIDFGESLVDGLKREINEEFGVEITVGDCFYAFTYTNHIKKSHSVEIIFFAQFASSEADIKLDPEDHSEYRWTNFEQYRNILRYPDDPEFKAVTRGFEILRAR
jgi:8-oxo-dGTP diphosphatase